MAFSRRSRFPRTSVQHRTQWEIGPETAGNGAPQALSATGASLAGTFASSGGDSITLIRTRGEFLIYLLTAGSAGDGFHGAFGIAKATSAALLIGASAVPSPRVEETWEGWLFHRYFSCLAAGPIAVATAAQETLQNASVTAALRLEVDSKAMRKINAEEGFYAAIDVIEHGVATAEWAFNSRMLIKVMS